MRSFNFDCLLYPWAWQEQRAADDLYRKTLRFLVSAGILGRLGAVWCPHHYPPISSIASSIIQRTLSMRQCCSPDCALALLTHHFVSTTKTCWSLSFSFIDLSWGSEEGERFSVVAWPLQHCQIKLYKSITAKSSFTRVSLPNQALQEYHCQIKLYKSITAKSSFTRVALPNQL